MSEPENNSPLANDPAREATASMRGYASQVWRSVLIWMRLEHTQRMYLEGAEDIDLLHGSAAETTQVKDTAGNITLRSPDVVEAINNAWLNQERNRERHVRYRFLTTSSIGMEQGDPLGLGIPGLKLWERTRQATEEDVRYAGAKWLKHFLLDERRVSSAVQAFLREAETSAIWERLISRIEWDTDSAEAPEVVQEIKNDLVAWGESRHIPAVDAEKVAAHLYERAWLVATMHERDRFLVRADAIRIFDEKTQISVPQAMIAAVLKAAFAQMPGSPELEGGISAFAAPGQTNLIAHPPSLPVRHFPRPSVIGEISTRLLESSGIVLYGSTGTGKSTLAVEYVAGTSIAWGWVDLRGVESSTLLTRLSAIARELESEQGITHVVLDDFTIPDDSRLLESPLRSIGNILRRRGGKLLITSATTLPQRLSLAVVFGPEDNLAVPLFSRDEITGFLKARGCVSDTRADEWTAVIELHTQGHAQLVHARIAALESIGFPEPSLEDLTQTPSEILEARTEARRLLGHLDGPARELVYRLSLAALLMRRRQVISIAMQPPAIAEPGLAFDKLIGPWIETLGEDVYRVSPLIRDAGTEILGANWALAAHRSIARGLLALRTFTPYDVAAILIHGVAGEDWGLLAQLAMGIFSADESAWSALAEAAGWFMFFRLGCMKDGESLPSVERFYLSVIRMFQYRLAAAGGHKEAALAIIAQFDVELPPDRNEEAPLGVCRHLFLGELLIRTEIPLPITRIVNISAEYITLSDALAGLLEPDFRTIPQYRVKHTDKSFDAASVAGFVLLERIDSRPAVRELLEACEQLPAATARRLLCFIGTTEAAAGLLFARSLVWESNQERADWVEARSVTERVYQIARKLDLSGLAQAAARAVAQMLDEYVGERAEALRIANDLAAEIGWSPTQEDGVATIRFRDSDFSGALDIWRRVLPNWQAQREFDIQQRLSCRNAAIAAASLDNWEESAEWLAAARERIAFGSEAVLEAALLIDEGYAWWKAGDNACALKRLDEGVHLIEGLPSDETDGQAHAVRKRAGHTLMWIAHAANSLPCKDFSAPPPACCSRLEPFPERVRPTSHDFMWAHLVEFEVAVEAGDQLLRSHEAALAKSPYGLVRMNMAVVRIRHRLRYLALDDLVELAVGFAEAMEINRRYYFEGGLDGTEPLPNDAPVLAPKDLAADIIILVMVSGVLVLAARGVSIAEWIPKWRDSAERCGVLGVLGPWFDLAASLFVMRGIDPRTPRPALGWSDHILVAIANAIDDSLPPEELLKAHMTLASILFSSANRLFLSLRDVESLIITGWLCLCERPFLLRKPSTTVPKIRRACSNSTVGWRKIGEILEAAADATPATVPDTMQQTIRKLIDD